MEPTNPIFELKTLPIWIMCFFSLILIALAITRGLKHKKSSALLTDGILLLGFFSFSYPIILLIVGLFQTADAVSHGAELSQTLIWSGVRNGLTYISMGFIAMHVSVIGWFVARRFTSSGSC